MRVHDLSEARPLSRDSGSKSAKGARLIDLNVDIGEGFGVDKELLKYASSANICCGEHAGSRDLALQTIELCKASNVRIGVHPGYPDRASMGRQPLGGENVREYLDSIIAQVKWFVSVVEPQYLKPHGAFYADTGPLLPQDWKVALLQIKASSFYEATGIFLAQYPGIQVLTLMLRINRLPLMGLEATTHRLVAERAGQPLIREGFADRAYTEEGVLVPRGEPGAVLEDVHQIRDQVLRLAPHVDSICLHGDTPHCLEFAELVHSTLREAGYEVGV